MLEASEEAEEFPWGFDDEPYVPGVVFEHDDTVKDSDLVEAAMRFMPPDEFIRDKVFPKSEVIAEQKKVKEQRGLAELCGPCWTHQNVGIGRPCGRCGIPA